MLFLTFWHISSKNLPEGTFRKRRLALEEARLLVDRARKEGKLVCTAKADLAAPYEEREWKRHVELCQALNELSIPISIDDFFGEVCCNALQFAYVGKGSDLLFIECCYTIVDPPRAEIKVHAAEPGGRGPLAWSSLFTIDPSTITFDLYSMVEIGPVGSRKP